ncbi:MAG: apolipoprotein N-acyltransferase [Planctomycetia bacterium]
MKAAWERRLWGAALGGALAMFLVQPPADLWWCAWLAPIPWLAIVMGERLPGPRPWTALWVGGFCHWLATIHWLRLPHPATSIGWILLSAYLACYLPAFIWLARRLVHGRGWPLVAAAPVAWMAMEQLRGWVLGGFTFGGLGHTQWRWTTLIQIADIAGAVGVGGLIMAVAAAVVGAVPQSGGAWSPRRAITNCAAAGCLLAAALAYGSWRLATAPPPPGRPLELLLVQGSIDTELKHDPEAATDVARHYDELTLAGLAAWPDGGRPDLIVWPETMWRWGLLEIDPAETLDEPIVERLLGPAPPAADEAVRADRQARCRRALEQERLDALAVFGRRYGTAWLVGLDKQAIAPQATRNFNCGLFLDATGAPVACYCKMHPVMFGEYIPLGDRFPFLYALTPLPAGLTAGREPVAVEIAGRRVAVNICYETALPEAVRSLVNVLGEREGRPDVIVNLTNDGWFWGSSELDMHLVAAIFRAVEVRTPIAIAANTGFSAAIDGCGRLLERGPRRATATLQARIHPDGRRSPWLAMGTLPTAACVAVAAAVTLAEGLARRGGGRLDGPQRAG